MKFKTLVITCTITIITLSMIIIHQLQVVSQAKTKPYIVCTTSIIADVVRNIGKDAIDVVSLMGPSIDPHLYKPIESDILKIASADIIFYNGLHLEAKMADLFKELSYNQTTVAVTKDIPESMLLPADEYNQIFDPHVWFDINLWIYTVNTIYQILSNKFPKNKNLYEKNTKKYITKLKQLLLETQQIMNSIPKEQKVLITGHDAFSYFGRLYNCKVIGLQGISTESSPGAYNIQKIINTICDNNIPAIFIESSIPIKNILAVQEGVAAQNKQINVGEEIYSDALGPKNSSGATYINMIMHNVTTIEKALNNK